MNLPTIEYKEQIDIIELIAKLEILEEIIRKIQSNLQNCLDLRYLTAESALKIMQNDMLSRQAQIMNSKHNVMLNLFNKKEADVIRRNNLG